MEALSRRGSCPEGAPDQLQEAAWTAPGEVLWAGQGDEWSLVIEVADCDQPRHLEDQGGAEATHRVQEEGEYELVEWSTQRIL